MQLLAAKQEVKEREEYDAHVNDRIRSPLACCIMIFLVALFVMRAQTHTLAQTSSVPLSLSPSPAPALSRSLAPSPSPILSSLSPSLPLSLSPSILSFLFLMKHCEKNNDVPFCHDGTLWD